MIHIARTMTLVFAAGCLGGLINSLVVWACGDLGITSALGVKMLPSLSAAWLYPRIVWGGIWGFLFLIPLKRGRLIYKGLLLSLGPTLVQLLVIFPLKAGKGMLGLDLGPLTPLVVIFFNAVWGAAAELWLRWIKED